MDKTNYYLLYVDASIAFIILKIIKTFPFVKVFNFCCSKIQLSRFRNGKSIWEPIYQDLRSSIFIVGATIYKHFLPNLGNTKLLVSAILGSYFIE